MVFFQYVVHIKIRFKLYRPISYFHFCLACVAERDIGIAISGVGVGVGDGVVNNCVVHTITFYSFEVGSSNSYQRSVSWRHRSSSNMSRIWIRSKVNELSMTGTVLCCTHNNFLYLRGRIAKFIQEVHLLKVQVKFECELNLIKVKGQRSMNFPWLALCCVVHTITFYSFEVGSPNSYQRSISWRHRSSSNMSRIWIRSKVNELSMTGTVLCCTHNNFLYIRGRIAKFIQEVHLLKVQVKFECELNLIKVKAQRSMNFPWLALCYVVHLIAS